MVQYFIPALFILLYSSLLSANNNFSISGQLLYFNYEEFSDTGASLNHETGFIPGINLTYNRGDNHLDFTFSHGVVDYDGHTQAGAPHATETYETLYITSYQRLFPFNDGLDKNNYYTKIAHTFWQRDIQANNGINGLYEEYSWWSFEAGIQTMIFQNDNQNMSFEIGILHTLNGRIFIDLRNQGYGYPELSLGNRAGINMSLSFTSRTSDQQSIYFNIGYQHWKFGKSNSRTLFNGSSSITIFEPRSHSYHSNISVGLINYF